MKPREDERLNSPLLYAITEDGGERLFRFFLDPNGVLYFSLSSLYDSKGLRSICLVDNLQQFCCRLVHKLLFAHARERLPSKP